MINNEDHTLLEKTFYPYLLNEKNRISKEKIKFVHYTSSENAVNILTNKCLWMRNSTCMNDYTEVSHGYQVVQKFFYDMRDSNGKHNFGLCEKLELLIQNSLNKFDDNWPNIRNNIYISSLSEHAEKEDKLGRLSMWRAYGGKTGSTALILKNPTPTNNLNIFLLPARYSDNEALIILREIFENFKRNEDHLINIDKNILSDHIFLSLVFIIVSLKHAGFKEEKEWRIIYLPTLLASDSDIEKSVENIGGVPQIVYKLPLDGIKIPNINISNMLEKIIIGPSNYPLAQHHAFSEVLKCINIDPTDENLKVSEIPLRM